jgi:hypothetical protein
VLGANRLEGDAPSQRLVHSCIHLTHSARAERLKDSVV